MTAALPVAARPLSVAVLGGGISGLASAFHLAGMGHRVVLHEASDELGGLAGSFEHEGHAIERFYHCLMPSDASLLALLQAIGMASEVRWAPVGMGFMVAGRVYPLNTPLDLLRFSALSFPDRLRMGWMALRSRWQGAAPELDGVTVGQWLRDRVGARLYARIWRPLLEAKLGTAADGIPALWLASRIVREKNSSQEVKGHVPGGYRTIVARLATALRARGVELRLRSPVAWFDRDGDHVHVGVGAGHETHDAVVGTLPLPRLHALARPGVRGALGADGLDYQGVLNAVFLTRRPLSRFYWMPIVESDALGQGVVEMGNLVPPAQHGGYHVNYVVNYAHRDSELYQRDDRTILDRHEADLRRLFPHAAEAIAARYLFRTSHVEPIWPLHYRARRPLVNPLPRRVYLAGTAQVYPRINAWDSCCEVAAEMAAAFANDHAGAPAPALVAR